MKPDKITPIAGTLGYVGTLVYDDFYRKVVRRLTVTREAGTTYVAVEFQDNTQCEVEVESTPHVRVSLAEVQDNGESGEVIARSTMRPVPTSPANSPDPEEE